MSKLVGVIDDPIHKSISVEGDEMLVLKSRPLRRLRDICQLGLTYLVKPGATHKRYEHVRGVMELAGRAYDVVTHPRNLYTDSARAVVPAQDSFAHQYWRRAVRMAGAYHDAGHLAFSHAGESLLPEGKTHEHLTVALIESDQLRPMWDTLNVKPSDVAKLAVGPEIYTQGKFTEWENILSAIITGDAFGVDRIDYLLRDSLHIRGVTGMFDHVNLINSLRILPKAVNSGKELALGIEQSGLRAVEGLLFARYVMYKEVYFSAQRRIYDHHLVTFLKAILSNGKFSMDIEQHLRMTDNDLKIALRDAASDPAHPGHASARIITEEEPFLLIYEPTPADLAKTQHAGRVIGEGLARQFGEAAVHYTSYREGEKSFAFPVWTSGGVFSAVSMSEFLARRPKISYDFVFIAPDKSENAADWLKDNRDRLLARKGK